MKLLLTIVLSAGITVASAQWSDTSNNFVDSLHMPVSTALSSQKNPIVLTSYPDGGYFVIWEDDRNMAITNTDIYAQKYDKAGNRLWALDGVPVSNGTNRQHYTFSSNQDYRNRSFAATDSAGGFYICYSDDSVSNYYWERVMVQHVRSNGSTVFPDPGVIMARSAAANLQMAAQLIPDGNKGFFISYMQALGNGYIYVYCYRDENGTLRYSGGGRMNENALQTSAIAPCGIKTDVIYPGTTVNDYNIWSDLDGGCNVIMDMSGNNGAQGRMLTYNRLWRAKKDSKSKTFFRNTSGTACPRTREYQQGSVYLMYALKTDYQSVFCGGGSGPAYAYTNYRLISNGYQVIDNSGYDYNYPKGTTVPTTGTINVTLMAVTTRSYINNALTDFIVKGYVYRDEKFDSVPYQHTTYGNPDFGYNTAVPFKVNKLNFFRDTLLAAGNYYVDFTLAGGGSETYAAALMPTVTGRILRLQHLTVSKKAADSFAIEYNSTFPGVANRQGIAIGKELSTAANISYDQPLIAVSNKGKAFFYIREYYRYARVSPIESGVQLAWGAMGRPVGSGYYKGSPYTVEQPVVALDSTGSSGIIAWKDSRFIPGNTGENIYMRHLDELDVFNYTPPPNLVKLLPNPYGANYTNPAVLFGTSKHYSPLEVYSPYISDGLSPVADILDNNNLGALKTGQFQNSAAIRKYNSIPYLNRNYTVIPETDATGKQVDMLLYFTKEELNALKAADPTIADPGYLVVIRQPNTSNGTPIAYTPVAGEEVLTPITWDSVPGGFFIKVIANGLGDFFIQKIPSVTLCSNANTSFTSNVTGSTYKWQVNTGGASYVDIGNNANYSGASTVTLQISNTPATFSGNRYRCVVDNIKVSYPFYLQVGDSWTGAVSNAWENPANWGCGKVPDANTDVVISSGSVTVSSNAVCRSLKVNPGATLNVAAGFTITVSD